MEINSKLQDALNDKTAPAVVKTPYSILRSTDYEIVRFVDDQHQKWLAADSGSRDRLYECLGAMLDINAGSWPAKERAELISKGRHPVAFNIAEQKINSLAGSIRSEKWDFDFIPVVGDKNSLTEGIKYLYYKDKDLYNYEWAENKTLLRGLLHSGYEIMEVRHDVDPGGGISFRPALPGTVLEDPNWMSDDYRDWTRAMLEEWMTPREMIEYFETNHSDVTTLATLDASVGEEYSSTDDWEAYRTSPTRRGSRYQVIEFRELITVKTTRLHMLKGPTDVIPLPVGVDETEVREYMAAYGIQSAEHIVELPYQDRVLQYTVVSPELSRTLILDKGKHNVQCGSIGIFPFSATREMGVKKGVMQSALDVQRTLNYRESKKDDIIAAGAAGGIVVDVDRLATQNGISGNAALDQIKQNKTRPDFVLGVHGDPSTIVASIPHGEVPNSILTDISSLIDMFDRVLPVTPALEGRAQEGESGIAFEMRHAVTKLGTLILYDNWRQHLLDKAEAWYYQAQVTYKNSYRRAMTELQKEVEFNYPVAMETSKGVELGRGNDLATLPRTQVICSLRKSSPTERYARRMEIYDITKILAGHGDMFMEEARVLINDMLDTFDRSPEEKAKIERLRQMKEARDVMNIMKQMSEIKAGDAQSKLLFLQAQTAIQNLMAQMQAQQMAGQGGVPQQVSSPQPDIGGGGGSAENLPGNPNQGTESQIAPGSAIQTIRGEFQP